MLIDGADPLVEESPLCGLLFRVLPFHFKYKVCAIFEGARGKSGREFVDSAVVSIENLKSQVIGSLPRIARRRYGQVRRPPRIPRYCHKRKR